MAQLSFYKRELTLKIIHKLLESLVEFGDRPPTTLSNCDLKVRSLYIPKVHYFNNELYKKMTHYLYYFTTLYFIYHGLSGKKIYLLKYSLSRNIVFSDSKEPIDLNQDEYVFIMRIHLDRGVHINIIIYNALRQIIQRYEPNGTSCKFYNEKDFDNAIKNFIFETLKVKPFFIKSEIIYGLQKIENKYRNNKNLKNIYKYFQTKLVGGYCLFWCVLMTELYIRNKMDFDKLHDYFLICLTKNEIEIDYYIDAYTLNFVRFVRDVVNFFYPKYRNKHPSIIIDRFEEYMHYRYPYGYPYPESD
jgi:hypothetical protein